MSKRRISVSISVTRTSSTSKPELEIPDKYFSRNSKSAEKRKQIQKESGQYTITPIEMSQTRAITLTDCASAFCVRNISFTALGAVEPVNYYPVIYFDHQTKCGCIVRDAITWSCWYPTPL